MINPKKQKNEKNRKRRPLNTSRRRFVTFLSPEIQLTNTHLLSVIVGLTFLCHARAHTSSVMLGLGVDSWRERAISEVRGLRDERGPTQLGIYTRASLDSPTKTGNDRKRNVIAGLDPAIHKHKALAHDMHAESNALRQSFVPQPMLRSSWPQLALYEVCKKFGE